MPYTLRMSPMNNWMAQLKSKYISTVAVLEYSPNAVLINKTKQKL